MVLPTVLVIKAETAGVARSVATQCLNPYKLFLLSIPFCRQELETSSRRSSAMARYWRGLCPAVGCSRLMMMMMMILFCTFYSFGAGTLRTCAESSEDINRLMINFLITWRNFTECSLTCCRQHILIKR
jgi:hypothetical protein